MLRLNKIECRCVVGHYDDGGNLVDEEVSSHVQAVYTEAQLGDYWAGLEAAIDARNADSSRSAA